MKKNDNYSSFIDHPEFGSFINKVSKLLYIAVHNYNSTPAKSRYIQDESDEKFPVFNEKLMDVAYLDNSIRLDAATKDQFEHLFNADFSKVKIHTGRYAQELTRNAKAFAVTIGNDIYFAQGYYSPDTEEGMKLLAHELQHVVQSNRGDRHLYREDIAMAEHEAGKIEEIMTPTLLFEMPSLDKTPSLQLAPTPFPYPNTGGMEKAALKKTFDAGNTGSLADFSKQKKKSYLIVFKDGSTAKLSQDEIAGVFIKFKEMVQEWIEQERLLRTDDEYQQNVIRFLA